MIDREQMIDELFAQAVELSRAEQDRFFERAAGDGMSAGNGVLDEVKALLRNFQSAEDDGFLYRPLVATESLDGSQTLVEGQEFEGYKILELIAEGGMGEVYLAHDPELDRKVAIKLIKSHLKTKELLRRFRNERQILANLQHPNIARLFEAGANVDGLPFFVMEYVEGQPIDQYARENQLSLTDRLRLFRTVCSAITCAHQNLVIHRDIKPNNILVTVKGEPKLLDFGIAKLLDESDKPEATLTMFHAMTPEYASPEQVKGEAITTASDVYSLGVLLYELLTGHRPYKLKRRTTDEITKAICEQEPERLSSAIKRTGGEVSAAVPPDVRKGWAFPARSPSFFRRGYASEEVIEAEPLPEIHEIDSRKGRAFPHVGAAEPQSNAPKDKPQSTIINPKSLRGDLDRIVLKALRKEPQRRYSSVEQFSEDIHRYLEGLPVSASKGTFSYRTSKYVQRNKVPVAAAAIILLTLISGSIATAWEARKARLEKARAERRFNDVRKLADTYMFEFYDSIKDLPGSLAARQLVIKRALEYLDSLAAEAGDDRKLQADLANAYQQIGAVTFDVDQMIDSRRHAMNIFEALMASDPNNNSYRAQLAGSYEQMSDAMKIAGNTPQQLAYAKKAIATIETAPVDRLESESRQALVYEYLALGLAQDEMGNNGPAIESERKAVAIQSAIVSNKREDKEALRMLSITYGYLSHVLEDNGDYAEALDFSTRQLQAARAMLATDKTNVRYERDVAVGLQKEGRLRAESGDLTGSWQSLTASLARMQKLSSADPQDKGHRLWLAVNYLLLGNVLADLHQQGEALEHYSKAVAIAEPLVAADNKWWEARGYLAQMYIKIGGSLSRTGQVLSARQYLQKAIGLAEESGNRDPQNARTRRVLAQAYNEMAVHWSNPSTRSSDKDSLREACAWYQKSRDIWQDMKDKGTLSGADAGKPDELNKEIAKCDAQVR